MTTTIRSAAVGDTDLLATLIEEVERFYGAVEIEDIAVRRAQVKQALFEVVPLAYALIAENGEGDPVGFAAYSFLWPAAGSTHSLFLKELYVREQGRRQGVATGLMRELHDIAAARPGCSRIEWMTDRDNPGARSFYRALGLPEFDGKIVYRVDT
nr:GNAT family N-acetyltransferase [Micromonospora sp. DSM 115978]